jgi:glycosyltransferase involved in cell wall biosynthesis
MNKVSIICPILNEEKYMRFFLESILHQTLKIDYEVILIDGISTDRTREIVHDYLLKYPNLSLLDNPCRFTPHALNIGIDNCKGDMVVRVDAHSIYPSNYLETLIEASIKLNADNVGCIVNTLPSTNSKKCKAIAYVISHPFGVGNSYFRIGTSEIRKVDTVPFGCFKKSLFDTIGHFDEELLVNQDDEFNSRILKNGGQIYLLPNISVDYFARDSIRKTMKMFYQYGLYKPLVNLKIGRRTSTRQLFPMLFLVGLCIGPLSMFIDTKIFYLYIFIINLYFFIGIFFSLNTFEKIKEGVVLFMPLIFFLVHISYGYGYIFGKIKLLSGKNLKNSIKITR